MLLGRCKKPSTEYALPSFAFVQLPAGVIPPGPIFVTKSSNLPGSTGPDRFWQAKAHGIATTAQSLAAECMLEPPRARFYAPLPKRLPSAQSPSTALLTPSLPASPALPKFVGTP